MRRIVLILTVALVMAAMMMVSIMPAFAQMGGPEGGNPGQGIPRQQERGTAGESGRQPLPFGGRSLRQAWRTLHRVLFAPLQGLHSMPQKRPPARSSANIKRAGIQRFRPFFLPLFT